MVAPGHHYCYACVICIMCMAVQTQVPSCFNSICVTPQGTANETTLTGTYDVNHVT